MSEAPNIQTIEAMAETYAAAVEDRRGIEAALRRAVQDIVAAQAHGLRAAAGQEADLRGSLAALVEAAPGLFERPKTRVLHGIKVGWVTGKARVEIPDEPATIAKIERLLPEDQAVLLIRVSRKVHKPGVQDLTAADCKRLGIRILTGEDAVIVKPQAGDVDRLVAALLAEVPDVDAAA